MDGWMDGGAYTDGQEPLGGDGLQEESHTAD